MCALSVCYKLLIRLRGTIAEHLTDRMATGTGALSWQKRVAIAHTVSVVDGSIKSHSGVGLRGAVTAACKEHNPRVALLQECDAGY